jgi:hypothetical protein
MDATLLGCWTGGGYVRSVYAPEPPLCACARAGHGSVREVLSGLDWRQILFPYCIFLISSYRKIGCVPIIPLHSSLSARLAGYWRRSEARWSISVRTDASTK